MSVQELHGIFQFTDDLFEEAEVKAKLIDMNYTAKQVGPGWYAADVPDVLDSVTSTENAVRFQITRLYYLKQYRDALELAKKSFDAHTIVAASAVAGIVRELAEVIINSHLQLKEPQAALPYVEHLKGVEEPGLLLVRQRAFYQNNMFEECEAECREFLRLRPGDYQIISRIGDCQRNLGRLQESRQSFQEALEILLNIQGSSNANVFDHVKAKLDADRKYIIGQLESLQ